MNPFLSLLTAAITLSLGQGNWEELRFDRVPANEVEFGEDSLSIAVEKSASPLVRVHHGSARVRKVTVTGRVEGTLAVLPDQHGEHGFDDALLRVGVIVPGGKRLNVIQRRLAPEWLRRIDAMFGERAGGVGEIRSALLVPHEEWLGKARRNPDIDLFHDRMMSSPGADGRFRMTLEFEDPPEVCGFWLLADGDDTGSSFRVWVEEFVVEGAE